MLFNGCSQQDPHLLRKLADQETQIAHLKTEIQTLQGKPGPAFDVMAESIEQQLALIAELEGQAAEVQKKTDTSMARLAELQQVPSGLDKIVFKSGLEIGGRVLSYGNGKMAIEDGDGNKKSGSPTSISMIAFRQAGLQPSAFPPRRTPPRSRPTPAMSSAPPMLELDFVRRARDSRLGRYSSEVKQRVSFTVRVTSREVLRDWEDLSLKIWVVSRDEADKNEYKIIIKESTTVNITRGQTVEHNTQEVMLRYYDSRYSTYKSGHKYYGYLLHLVDANGKIIKKDISHQVLERNESRFVGQAVNLEFSL